MILQFKKNLTDGEVKHRSLDHSLSGDSKVDQSEPSVFGFGIVGLMTLVLSFHMP